jgi:hypothetical protein
MEFRDYAATSILRTPSAIENSHAVERAIAHSVQVDAPTTDSQQTTAHGLAQLIMVMCIVVATALALALVGSIAGRTNP